MPDREKSKIVCNLFQKTKLLHERLAWPDDALRRVLYDQDSDGFCIPSDSRAAGAPCAGGRFGNASKTGPAAW